jgi:hypothetical protein
MLNDQGDVFEAIFLTKVDNPLLRYDIAARYGSTNFLTVESHSRELKAMQIQTLLLIRSLP